LELQQPPRPLDETPREPIPERKCPLLDSIAHRIYKHDGFATPQTGGFLNFVAAIGRTGLYWMEAFGDYVRFVLKIQYWLVRGPGRFARRQLLTQMFDVGTLSIPVVMITGGFIGAVLAIEAFPQFKSIGMEGRIGSVINISVVKQIGPVLTAVMLAGRVGGALTAELGTMKVTEQIDALRAMASDPIRSLVVPRFMACIIMTPILTVFSDALGMLGGWLMAVKMLGVDPQDYWTHTKSSLEMYTIYTGFIKAFFFGAAIASIACYKGFNCGPGAQGVGRACTESFVASFITILVMNFFIAMFMNTLYEMLWPGTGSIFG
jgi:phospholipid/cholesterol/gamma-HCH transport system permease protein